MQPQHKKFLEDIIRLFEIQPSELIHISEAFGRVLASDVRARYTLPYWDISAVNGYALYCEDTKTTPVTLKIIGESTAGSPYKEELEHGQAVKLYAGSPVPIGADTIVPMQNVERKGHNLLIKSPVMQGQNICFTGVDFQRNESVLKAGYIVSPRDISLACAMKTSWVHVRRRPHVGFFAIGDELAMLGDDHDGMKIVSSSSMMVSAFISACGAIPVNLGIATDTEVSINKHMEMARGVDMVITTGGVSASADGLIKNIMDKKGTLIETLVKLSSPSPVILGEKYGIPLLALPGNPISAKMCCTLFLKPILHTMTGTDPELSKTYSAALDRDLDVNDLEMDYIFSRLTQDNAGHLKALPASSYDRMLLSALAQADCLITVNHGQSKKGEAVNYIRFA